jgi:hypothetical protein
LVDRAGVLPLKDAMLGKGPHRYAWTPLEVEEGARSTTFTLSHHTSASYWMYLVDPAGNEVHPSSGDVVAWNAGPEPYEFAKIAKPMGGQWLVVGLRLDRGPSTMTSAVAAINHPEVVAHGGVRHGHGSCPVEFHAGARYVEPLSGITATAWFRRVGGPWQSVVLHDHLDDGGYRGFASLPSGVYRGHIELRSPNRPLVADPMHLLLHAESAEIGETRVDAPAFVRHVPIAFAVGRQKDPSGRVPEDEQKRERGEVRPPIRDPRIWHNPRRLILR